MSLVEDENWCGWNAEAPAKFAGASTSRSRRQSANYGFAGCGVAGAGFGSAAASPGFAAASGFFSAGASAAGVFSGTAGSAGPSAFADSGFAAFASAAGFSGVVAGFASGTVGAAFSTGLDAFGADSFVTGLATGAVRDSPSGLVRSASPPSFAGAVAAGVTAGVVFTNFFDSACSAHPVTQARMNHTTAVPTVIQVKTSPAFVPRTLCPP